MSPMDKADMKLLSVLDRTETGVEVLGLRLRLRRSRIRRCWVSMVCPVSWSVLDWSASDTTADDGSQPD